MIVITGATGALNGATTEHLLERVPAAEIAVVVRDVAKAEGFAARGVTVRQGAYEEPEALVGAFEGADQLLLVSSNDPRADAVSLHRNAVDAAVTAGAKRILYTSHQGAGADSPFGPARDHAATEQMLVESGVAWTSLRNGFYAHTLTWMLGQWRATGIIEVPTDGPVSWTAREDLAEAAAVILQSDGAYDGPTTLTAGAAPTFEDIAALASQVIGRSVRCVVMGEDEWLTAQVENGTPEFVARFSLGTYQAAEQGRFATVSPLLCELLEREPRTVRDLLAQTPTP